MKLYPTATIKTGKVFSNTMDNTTMLLYL